MMQELWSGPVRCYFNAFEEAPLVWSVDDGDVASEIKTQCVHFEAAATTQTGPPHIQPKAWLKFEEATVYRVEDGSILVAPSHA